MPRRSGFPGLERGESRGWGRRDSQIPPSPLFGAPARSNEIYKSDEVFLIEEAKTNDPSPTSLPYKKSKEISQLQVKQAETASTAKTARLGTGCQGILVPAAREYRRLQVRTIGRRDKVPTECEKFAKIRGILLHDGDRIGIIVSWGIFPTESENVGGLRI